MIASERLSDSVTMSTSPLYVIFLRAAVFVAEIRARFAGGIDGDFEEIGSSDSNAALVILR